MTRFLLAASAAIAGLATSGYCLEVPVEYSGTITAVPGTLTNTFSVGDTFFGTYLFDTTTAANPGATTDNATYNAIVSGELELDTQLQNLIQLDYEPVPSPGEEIQVENSDTFNGGLNDPQDRYAIVNRVSGGLTPLVRPASGAGNSVEASLLSAGFAIFGGPNVDIFDDASLPVFVDYVQFQRSSFLMLFNVEIDPPVAGGNDMIIEAVIGQLDYVDFLLPEFEPGDANADGVVNTLDIDAFVLALTDPEAYEEQFYFLEPTDVADTDFNGLINTLDIDPFVALLTGEASGLAPEPAAVALVALWLSPLTLRRRSCWRQSG